MQFKKRNKVKLQKEQEDLQRSQVDQRAQESRENRRQGYEEVLHLVETLLEMIILPLVLMHFKIIRLEIKMLLLVMVLFYLILLEIKMLLLVLVQEDDSMTEIIVIIQ